MSEKDRELMMRQAKVLSGFLLTMQLILVFNVYEAMAFGCSNLPPTVISVSQSGQAGTFRTIQSAIDSVPSNNNRWFRILVSAGTYREKITITADKTCIFLQGAGSRSTIIEWSDGEKMVSSATFAAKANDFAAMGIGFKNTYNLPPKSQDEIEAAPTKPALAVEVSGDRAAFYFCTFQGMQDTLFDELGRHFFYKCIIQGEVDFIFGNGQSIYQQCVITFMNNPAGLTSYITAQGRESIDQTSGFVFKKCIINGNGGQAYLGRAYRPFSRVIIVGSVLTNVVYPSGWYAWENVGHEANLTYVEEGNSGPGAYTSKRVPWMKHMDRAELKKFLRISYIDTEGWLDRIPKH